MKKNILKILLIANLVFSTFSLILITYIFFDLKKDTVYENIFVSDVNLSGLKKDDVKKILDENFNFSKNLELNYQDKKYYVDLNKFGFSYDTALMSDKAVQYGKNSNFLNNIFTYFSLKMNNSYTLDIAYKENYEELRKYLNDLSSEINTSPINATLKNEKGKIILTKETIGKTVNIDETISSIKTLVDSGYKENNVSISYDEKHPEITTEKIKNIDTLVATYKTNYRTSPWCRKNNIELGALKIDHMLIMPNEEVSFNKKVGNVTKEMGFQYATVIENNKLVPGIGGGLCQVSSTMYNAILKADLLVTERHKHSKGVSYVLFNRDTTVSYPHLDLKFKNNHKVPIYIRNFTKNGIMITEIYSGKNYFESKI